MVITAVHLDDKSRPVRYKVENSWSDAAGEKGWFMMTADWFKENVFQVVIPRSVVDAEWTKVLDAGNPVVLPPWDPMVSHASLRAWVVRSPAPTRAPRSPVTHSRIAHGACADEIRAPLLDPSRKICSHHLYSASTCVCGYFCQMPHVCDRVDRFVADAVSTISGFLVAR
jgi:hypothetical protein